MPRYYRRFSDYDGSPPEVPKGIRVIRTEDDLGPATKVLPAAASLQGSPDVQLLFCDDDRLYDRGWAASLSRLQQVRPGQVVALSGRDIDVDLGVEPPADRAVGPRFRVRSGWRRSLDAGYFVDSVVRQLRAGSLRQQPRAERAARRWVGRAGYADILQGWGGVVVRPRFFGPEDLDVPDEAYHVDDVWLSAMVARRGVPIWIASGLPAPRTSKAHEHEALWQFAASRGDPDEPDRTCISYVRRTFGVWPTSAGRNPPLSAP
ncbi:hypothetical protein [Oceanicola sp. 502str15]|uniref:hypothetical protein n=1 Tax=Oceanicola sp. 502str15 TaxID=2696061 RepID=UPI0020940428|nr:hypothetical protein [Oceanicola sp. 502str15]MCO6385177.1 glycosyltransferase family 2 protein [Oceanicola sp. 502str15]